MAQANPGQQLLQLASQYHHWHNENKAKGPESTRNRRHEEEMEALGGRFQRLCEHWITDVARREAWYAHLYHHAPPPPVDDWPQPLVFLGAAQPGNRVEVRGTEDGYRVTIDRKQVARKPPETRFPEQPIAELHVSGIAFEEHFAAPEAALERLVEWYEHPEGDAPWEWSRDLYLDGLIDPDFSLTVRGKRLVERRRGDGRGHAVMRL